MAIRVALLILVTGAFVALWSGDQPQAIASIPPVKSIQDIRQITPSPVGEPLSRSPINASDVVPLPEGITAGTYLIADRFGRTQIRQVAPNEISRRAKRRKTVAKDHYAVESNGARWHFVRIETANPEQTAGQTGSAPRR